MKRKREKKNAGTGNPSLSSGNATDSICPYGWQLPEYDGDKSFQNLIATIYNSKTGGSGAVTYANTMPSAYPIGMLIGGHYEENKIVNGHAMYYGRNRNGTKNAHVLYFYSIVMVPTYNRPRGYGLSLRCLAR